MRIQIVKYLAIIFTTYLLSCDRQHINIDSLTEEVRSALDFAGNNKAQLLKVIEFYSKSPKDSLKLKAALFLIANMKDWHHYQGHVLEKNLQMFYAMRRNNPNRRYFTLDFHDNTDFYKTLKVKYDIQEITGTQLKENIEMAFKVWQEQPWGKDYNFEQFCEYILPFKMADEVPEYNRRLVYNQFNPQLDSIRSIKDDAVSACASIKTDLKDQGWVLTIGYDFLPHQRLSQLIEHEMGSCRDQTDFGAYILRSVGIPATIDFVPQWPTRSNGHSFNAVIDKNNRSRIFEACGANPLRSSITGMKKGKVFRYSVKRNKESLASIRNEHEIIPELFYSPFLQDVTDAYGPTFDITIEVKNKETPTNNYKRAYLCLFNNSEWIPVHWGSVTRDSVVFTKMEDGIVYLPAYYNSHGIIPANFPFILQNKKVKFLIPDTVNTIQSINIKRIFPNSPNYVDIATGIFQGCNNRHFQNPTLLWNVLNWQYYHPENIYWHQKSVTSNDSFRYVRYFTKGQCRIGEMEFFAGGRKLTGTLISPENDTAVSTAFSPQSAIDGELATSYISRRKRPSWVGIDFGKPEKIDSIRFSAGLGAEGRKCLVIPGHKYELKYWSNGTWKVCDSITAKNATADFKNVPSGALYLVRDLTEQAEQRCFTIERGKQTFW